METIQDIDPEETGEWLDSLEAVIDAEGVDRAHFLLENLITKARLRGSYLPYNANTPYLNTIPVDRQPHYPGDREIERRISSIIRWNALAMVVRANKHSSELGGHIASFQSAATLYDIGFGHFWRAPLREPRRRHHLYPGPFVPGHLRARIRRRPPDRGAAAATSAAKSTAQGPLVLSASVADAGFLAIPDRVDGPRADHGDLSGALHEVSRGARPRRDGRSQGLGLHGRRRDGRARIARRNFARRARKARQPDLRRQLQPAAARRSGARQRQDHPGTRGRLPRRRMERHQGHLGQQLGCAARARQARIAAQADGRMRRRRVPGFQVARRRICAQGILRQVPRAARDGLRHDRRRSLAAPPRRPRPDQGLRRPMPPRSAIAASPPSSSPKPSRATGWARPARA